MQSRVVKISAIFLFAVNAMVLLAHAGPNVSSTTTFNIGGSGYNALDFYFAATAGAEFTNYRLNLETTNGAFVFDPFARECQSFGGQSIDTFMNTVGSLLGMSQASHVQNVYRSAGPGASASAVSRIDWSVYDMLQGDTNNMGGNESAPYHLARILVGQEAIWSATFSAFDTFSCGVPATFQFSNSPQPGLELPNIDLLSNSVPLLIVNNPAIPRPPSPEPPPSMVSPVVIEQLPAPQLPTAAPTLVRPPVATDPIEEGADGPPSEVPSTETPIPFTLPIDWDGEVRIFPILTIDIQNFAPGSYWSERLSHIPSFAGVTDFTDLSSGAVLYSMTDSLTNGSASIASFAQAIADATPTPEPAVLPLVGLAIAIGSAFRRH